LPVSGAHGTFRENTTLAPASQLGFASVDIWGEMQTFYEVDMHLLTCRDCDGLELSPRKMK